MIRKNRQFIYNILTILLFTIGLIGSSCSTTKNLPVEETLYTGIRDISITNQDESEDGKEAIEEIEAALSYAPNDAILGSSSIRHPFHFGLWNYNAFVNKQGKIGKWLFKKLAAKPVYISTVNPEVRVKIAQNLLKEYGFFRGNVSYQLEPNKKDAKQSKISYHVDMNRPYTYDSIAYVYKRNKMDTIVRLKHPKSLLKVGDNFNAKRLEAERERVSTLLRNKGFYYFQPTFISYEADTFMREEKVVLRVSAKPGLPAPALHPWKIGDITVNLHGYMNEAPTDSIRYKDLLIRYEGKLRVRPKVLYKKIHFRNDELYSQDKQTLTQNQLSQLGIFRYSEMQYQPQDSSENCHKLNLNINTVYDLPIDGELELNVTTKSNDQTGPGAVFGVTKRNIFGGGETLGIGLRGSYEWQTGKRVAGKRSAINSWEFGADGTLTFPEILVPRFMLKNKDIPGSTTFKIYGSQLNRAKFFKMLAFGGNATYDFQSSPTNHHTFTPFQLTYSLLQRTTHNFDSITSDNPALKRSLDNQFIPAVSYTFTYDNSSLKNKRHHLWWQTSVTQAGNVLNAIYAMTGKKYSKKDKSFIGNKFAQYVKLTSEIHYDRDLGNRHHLVGRVMGGVAYSYGNSSITPYTDQFYIGGANSLRAFTIRSIGPGRFRPKDPEYGYLDQTGDIKFEANLEYRFPIFADLHGAAFLDAGNIWSIRHDQNRLGSQLKWGHFLKDLALGTGIGLRYDLSFLILRIDWGIGLHVPYETGKKGYYNIPDFKDAMGIHFAIGYPF